MSDEIDAVIERGDAAVAALTGQLSGNHAVLNEVFWSWQAARSALVRLSGSTL